MATSMMQENYARRVRWLMFFVLSFIISGCNATNNPKPPELGTGLVFPGGGNTISLGGFWFNTEGGGVSPADRIAETGDPMGGFLFLYWIDDKGNVCHGQPGVSGQPGPVYVNAFQLQANSIAQQGTPITTTQLQDFQKIPYDIAAYVANTQASGLHFVQYGNILWRARSDGSTSRFADWIHFSVPLIMSVDTTNTIFPYFPADRNVCSKNQGVPLPPFPGSNPSPDPSICGTRALPATASMNYQDSLKYCLINLPHGLN